MRNLTIEESLKIESINLRLFRVPANSKTKIEELDQREFEWFIGKGRMFPSQLTAEFFAYLTSQISPRFLPVVSITTNYLTTSKERE